MTSVSHVAIPTTTSNESIITAISSHSTDRPKASTAAGTAPLRSTSTITSAVPLNGIATAKHTRVNTNPSLNSRITPAIPSLPSPTIVNKTSTPASVNPASSEYRQKPSVTSGAVGIPGYMPNGTAMAGKPVGGNGIQFGALKPDGSPASVNASLTTSAHTGESLAVNAPTHPRVISPSASPSPIPQPPISGGKPPSSLHGHSNSLSFGNFGGPEGNVRPPSTSQGSLISGPQASHLRRESSHSQHSDAGPHLSGGSSGRGGYPQPGGRGRGYSGPYQQQMPYSSSPNFRQPPNQPRNGANMPPFQQQGRPYQAYPNSPHQQPVSPMPPNARPASVQPGQMPPQGPHLNQPQYGMYPGQPYGYNPQMGPQQMGYHMPQQQMDPNFAAQWYHMYGHHPPPQMGPSQSPRPQHQYPPGSQPTSFSPYGPQPPAMSRNSSAISGSDRPASSMGKPVSSATPVSNHTTNGSRASLTPAPKTANFQKPKKSAGIVIKDPNSGEVVDLKEAAAVTPAIKTPAGTSSATSTPPPIRPDSTHSRTESALPKADGNDLKAQLARQMKAKEDAEAKIAKDKQDAESKLQQEKTDAEAKIQADTKARKDAEDAAEEKKRAEVEEAAKAAKTKASDEEAKKSDVDDGIDEDEIARWEAEAAEEERKEKEREAAYAVKKQAERDEAARKEAESFKMADEDMKRAEREAEEAELKRAGKGPVAEEDAKDKDTDTASVGSHAAEDTPTDSGIATPGSDVPAASASDRKGSASAAKGKPSALVLDTHKAVEPPQPSAALLSLRSAKKLIKLSEITYPEGIVPPSPDPATTQAEPGAGKFVYDRDFLLQFKNAYKDVPFENWDVKVRETIGDGGEPQSARGTPRSGGAGSVLGGRQPSNRGMSMQGQMGTFGQPSRTLAPGTTSQQRFDAASRGTSLGGRNTMQNPLAGYVAARPGAFPQPASSVAMNRSPSTTSLNHPNSPRNASQRGGSQRGSRPARREDPKDNKTMPLTAGGNVKPIEVSASGWKPRSIGAVSMAEPAPGGDGLLAPDDVQRKVKSNLNKMTPNNFDKIAGQILEIAHQSKHETDGRSLRQVIQLTFEKATDEAHWAEMYAQFCKRMLESMSPEIKDENILDKKGEVVIGGALFRKYLLTRCQTEFERGWKMNLPDKPEGEQEEAATMLSEEYYIAAAAKRRGLGLVRFIGELYKLQMLTERIMHECVKKLVDYEGIPDEAEVESLTSLLKTIGQQLDATDKGRTVMDVYFSRIRTMIDLKDLPSRLRFMLMDVVDLRTKNHWQPKGGAVIKGPTTLDEVRAQAVEQERLKEVQRIQDNSRRGGGGGGGRLPIGRGDARNFSGGGMMPPPDYQRNHVDVGDLRRLGSRNASRQTTAQGPQLGPPSMFAGQRGSNRRTLASASAADSGSSSRVSTPPASKDKKEKDDAVKSDENAFSVLAEGSDATSPGTSPALTKAQPAIAEITSESKDAGERTSKPSDE